jgi:glycosyltransferase involved in cell wall biosynthesis
MVEANLAGGYEIGLEHGAALAANLSDQMSDPVELAVAGRVPEKVRRLWEKRGAERIHWLGQLPTEAIPALDRSAHLLFAADLLPACPNTVIEALACGLPVCGFRTGALPEIIRGDSGRLADYGGDPWKLESPDIQSLAEGALEILSDQDRFRAGARARAVEAFGLEKMVTGYLRGFGWS